MFKIILPVGIICKRLIDLANMLNITVEFGHSFDIIDFFFYVPDCKVLVLNTLRWLFIVLTCRHVICDTVLFINNIQRGFQ